MAKRIIEIRKARGGTFQAHLLDSRGKKPAWSTEKYAERRFAKSAANNLKDLLWNDVTCLDVQIVDKTAA